MEARREELSKDNENKSHVNVKACALAVLATMSTFSANASTVITVDGTVIEGSYTGSSGDIGGAIYNKAKDVLVTGAEFKDNKSTKVEYAKGDGGAFREGSDYETTSLIRIENSSFINNTAVTNGGALSAGNGSIIKDGIIDTLFEGNKADYKDGSLAEDDRNGQGGAIAASGKIEGQGIKDCTFKNNTANRYGGAIANWGEISAITNTLFEDNTARFGGGAISGGGTITTINNSVFKNNISKTDAGGAIAYQGTIVSIKNSRFTGNTAASGGAFSLFASGNVDLIADTQFDNNSVKGDFSVYGGAIANSGSIKEISNSKFTNNSLDSQENMFGGAIFNNGNINNISNAHFEKNTSSHGGAIYDSNKLGKVSGSTFNSNKAVYQGGAISTISLQSVENSKFTSNIVENSGAKPVVAQAYGGAIFTAGELTVSNTEFTDNQVKSHLGVASGSAIYSLGSLAITDSSFYNNKAFSRDPDMRAAAVEINGIGIENVHLDIFAKDKNVTFSGNEISLWNDKQEVTKKDNVDLNLYGAYANFNANKNRNITFNGKVNQEDDYTKASPVNYININNTEGYTGKVEFDDVLSTSVLNLYRGTVKTGAAENGDSNLNINNMVVKGGTIDLSNDYIENVNLDILNFEADGDVVLDADLGTNSIDSFTVNSTTGSGKINIKNINMLSDITEDSTSLKFIKGTDASAMVKVPTLFTSVNRYDATVDFDLSDTIINIVAAKGEGGLANMTEYVPPSAGQNIAYTMTEDEIVDRDLTPFHENVASVIIAGHNHTVTANQTKGFEISAGQDFELNDIASISGFKNENGGAVYNNGGNSSIARTAFNNNSASGDGGAIYTSSDINIIDTSFTGNNAGGKGGAIYAANGANVTIDASTRDIVFKDNTAASETNDIYMDSDGTSPAGTLYLNTTGTKISLHGIKGSDKGYAIAINQGATNAGGVVEVNGSISNATANGGINMYAGTLKLQKDSYINNNSISLYGGTIDMMNNAVSTLQLKEFNLSGNGNIAVDVDLANRNMDRLSASSVKADGTLNVTNMNVLSDSKYINTTVKFTGSEYGTADLSKHVKNSVKEAKGPIYKYNVSGYQDGTDYNFKFTNKDGHGDIEYNPDIYTTPVALQLGGYANQLSLYQSAFGSMDMLNFMTKEQRAAYIQSNKLASTDVDTKNVVVYSPTNLPVGDNTGIWFKPNAAFEKVNFKDGPDVSNFMYNTLIGADSGLRDMGADWSGIFNAYGGYIGSHQSFDDVKMYQNGGVFGVSGMLYKNNFFGGLTANIGISGVDAHYDLGKENFAMLSTGVAGKFGYNWALAKGKFIIQPNVTASYSFIKAFNHKTGAEYEVNADGMHGIQVAPGLKLIGNFKNNWQPYVGASFMWNIMGKASETIEGIDIPAITMKPYIQYSVGIQKKIGKRFTGYAEFMGRNIGRNGFAFGLGGRWELGSDKPKQKNEKQQKSFINSDPNSSYNHNYDSSQNTKPTAIITPLQKPTLESTYIKNNTNNNYKSQQTPKNVQPAKNSKQTKYTKPARTQNTTQPIRPVNNTQPVQVQRVTPQAVDYNTGSSRIIPTPSRPSSIIQPRNYHSSIVY